MTQLLEYLWYDSHTPIKYLKYVLLPFSWLYRSVIAIRRTVYQSKLSHTCCIPAHIPVIVVGNLTLGGTGKTPLVIALIQWLQELGWHAGVVSRGYGGKAKHYPLLVTATSDPRQAGDEPVLIATRTGCPVAVAPRRNDAIKLLISQHACNIILSDDGLQHYAMRRNLEIVVIDGTRMLGNKLCLPAGPLREPVSRLQEVDYIIINGDTMQLQPLGIVNLVSNARIDLTTIKATINTTTVHAVAGIGNPQRFFADLRNLGLQLITHKFADHYQYQPTDLDFCDTLPIIMTEKDAIKCRRFATAHMYYLEISAQPDTTFKRSFCDRFPAL